MAETWSTTLNFIYYQQAQLIDMKQGLEVLECSRKFQLEDLEEAVTDFIESILDNANCCEAIMVSDRLGSVRVRNKAIQVLASRFWCISRTDTFSFLEGHVLENVLKSDNLLLQSELDVLQAIIRWSVKHGHKVDPKLLREYSKSSLWNHEDENTLMEPSLTEERINVLFGHIRIDGLNLVDLQDMLDI